MALTTPTADIGLIYTAPGVLDASAGQVELALTPAGDLQRVVGLRRLQQDITRWLLTPRGAVPFEPSYGNPLLVLWGRPVDLALSDVASMVASAEDDFVQRQALAAAQGYLALDEQVDHFENVQIDQPTPMAISVTFTVVARSGSAAPLTITLT
jgi:phage baseplate assembly protein W